MKDLKNIAYLTTPPDDAYKMYVEKSIRPLHIAFLIQNEISMNNFLKLIELNTCLWGGIFNLFIPVTQKGIDNFWYSMLLKHRPDIIMLYGNKDFFYEHEDLLKKLEQDIQPFALRLWSSSNEINFIFDSYYETDEQTFALPMISILENIYEKNKESFRESNSNINILNKGIENPLYLASCIQTGIVDSFYRDFYIKKLKSNILEFNDIDFQKYLVHFLVNQGSVSPLYLTDYNIQRTFTMGDIINVNYNVLNLFIIGDNWLSDLSCFWNIRSSRHRYWNNGRYLVLPQNFLNSKKFLKHFSSVLANEDCREIQRVDLSSYSISNKKLDKIQINLNNELKNNLPINIITQLNNFPTLNIKYKKENDIILIENDKYHFKPPQLDFPVKSKLAEWVTDIQFNPPLEYPIFSQLNEMLSGKFLTEIQRLNRGFFHRYYDEKVSIRTRIEDDIIIGRILKADDIFIQALSKKNIKATLSDKHPYTLAFSKLLPSLDLLNNEKVRALLWNMVNNKVYTFKELQSQLSSAESGEMIDLLVKHKILLQGMSFRCEYCGFNGWYHINQLKNEIECVGCLNKIRLPTDAPIRFKLNQLISMAVRQGSIPVLLTKRVLDEQDISQRYYVYGIKFEERNEIKEIDLITTFQGQIIFAECKDFKEHKELIQKDLNKLIEQVESVVGEAKKFGVSGVVFSTLLQLDIPEFHELCQRILLLNRKYKIGVHLLSLAKMKFIDLRNPPAILEHPNLLGYYS